MRPLDFFPMGFALTLVLFSPSCYRSHRTPAGHDADMRTDSGIEHDTGRPRPINPPRWFALGQSEFGPWEQRLSGEGDRDQTLGASEAGTRLFRPRHELFFTPDGHLLTTFWAGENANHDARLRHWNGRVWQELRTLPLDGGWLGDCCLQILHVDSDQAHFAWAEDGGRDGLFRIQRGIFGAIDEEPSEVGRATGWSPIDSASALGVSAFAWVDGSQLNLIIGTDIPITLNLGESSNLDLALATSPERVYVHYKGSDDPIDWRFIEFANGRAQEVPSFSEDLLAWPTGGRHEKARVLALTVGQNQELVAAIQFVSNNQPTGFQVVRWKNGVWQHLPAPDIDFETFRFGALTSDHARHPVLVWSESRLGSLDVYGMRFDGNNWEEIYGSNSRGGISNSEFDSVAGAVGVDPQNGRICVSWAERDQLVIRCADPAD